MRRTHGVWGKWLSKECREWKEIIAPSPLPNPPEYIPPKKPTLNQLFSNIKSGIVMYKETWLSEKHEKEVEESQELVEEGNRMIDEAKLVTRKGSEVFSNVVKNEYGKRLRAYQKGIQEFISGYKEGLRG